MEWLGWSAKPGGNRLTSNLRSISIPREVGRFQLRLSTIGGILELSITVQQVCPRLRARQARNGYSEATEGNGVVRGAPWRASTGLPAGRSLAGRLGRRYFSRAGSTTIAHSHWPD